MLKKIKKLKEMFKTITVMNARRKPVEKKVEDAITFFHENFELSKKDAIILGRAITRFINTHKKNKSLQTLLKSSDELQIGSVILTGISQQLIELKIEIEQQIKLLTKIFDNEVLVSEIVKTTCALSGLLDGLMAGLSSSNEKKKQGRSSEMTLDAQERHRTASEVLLRMACRLGSLLGGYMKSEATNNIDEAFEQQSFNDFISACFEAVTLNMEVESGADFYNIAKSLVDERLNLMQDYQHAASIYQNLKISKQEHAELLEGFKKTTIRVALGHISQIEESIPIHH